MFGPLQLTASGLLFVEGHDRRRRGLRSVLEVGLAGLAGLESTVERRCVPCRPKLELVCLSVAADASAALDSVEGLEPLGVQREEREAQQVGLGPNEVGDQVFFLVGWQRDRRRSGRRLKSVAWSGREQAVHESAQDDSI